MLSWQGLTLAWWGMDLHSSDGRMRGAWCGAMTDDEAPAARLQDRGVPARPDDHGQLAIDEVALAGPEAPAAWRWQGSFAVAHLAQRQVLLGRDPMGVGGLYASAEGLASDPALLTEAVPVSSAVVPVPPGVVALVGVAGRRWQRPKLQSAARPWLREVPESLRWATRAEAERGLVERLTAAAAACARGLGGLGRETPVDAAGRWLTTQVLLAEQPSAGGYWTLAGAASLWGPWTEAPEWLAPGSVRDLPEREIPEPTEGLPPDEIHRRRWRATWLPERDLAAARQLAEQHGRVLVAPQLDVGVLAWLGALAPGLLRLP